MDQSINDGFFNPANENQDFSFSGMTPQLGIPRSLPFLDQFDPCPQDFYVPTPPYRQWLEDSKPADFLAIRKTQGR